MANYPVHFEEGSAAGGKVRVMLEQAEGLIIKSAAFFDVEPGSTVVFETGTVTGYLVAGVSEGIYDEESGQIILSGVKFPTTVKVSMRKNEVSGNTPEPGEDPSASPSTFEPTIAPTAIPSATPTSEPTASAALPVTESPATETPAAHTAPPVTEPPATETAATATPTAIPTVGPTTAPTAESTAVPTAQPTTVPTTAPTAEPTATPVTPTNAPTAEPTAATTAQPTTESTTVPTTQPTTVPTTSPTAEPTAAPTAQPTAEPTDVPTAQPTAEPTAAPTAQPTAEPTAEPATPTEAPTEEPLPEIALTLKDPKKTEKLTADVNAQGDGFKIIYHANGGTIAGLPGKDSAAAFFPLDFYYCPSTLPDTGYFEREGYMLVGYTEDPDGTGKYYGPGWKIVPDSEELNNAEGDNVFVKNEKDLYCKWVPFSPVSDFEYAVSGDAVIIKKYLADGGSVAIPDRIDGKKVGAIAANAFAGKSVREICIPKYVEIIYDGAFGNCAELKTVYLSDSVLEMRDDAFSGCTGLTTLNLLAVRNPGYSSAQHGTCGSIKYDRLMTAKNKKMIIVGGSNLLYGINSGLLEEKLGGEYTILNMGTTVYYIAMFSLDIISKAVGSGDCVVIAPELFEYQLGGNEFNATMWQCLETLYGAVAGVDISRYGLVFTSFTEFNRARAKLSEKSYSQHKKDVDRYGEADTVRDETTENYKVRQASFRNANGQYSFLDGVKLVKKYGANLNASFDIMLAKGCKTLVSFASTDRCSLKEDSGSYNGRVEIPPDTLVYDKAMDDYLHAERISVVRDYIFEPECFYDSSYHLTTESRDMRTELLARDILNYLNGSSGE